MKSYLFKSLWIAMIGVFFNPLLVKAQTDLTKETAFFQKAGKDYQRFLENTEFDKIIRLDTVQVFSDKVILELVMTNYNDWASLAHQYEKDFDMDFKKMLFDKATFLFEIEDDLLGIRVWSSNFTLLEVQLYYEDNQFKAIENPDKGVHLDSLVIETKRLPKIAKMDTYTKVETCKQKIQKALESKYKKNSKDAAIKVSSSRSNELKLWVSNIRGEVIDDSSWFPYWEYITISITFKEQNGQFKIYYKVQAKYGSGIFKGPRLSDYKDMAEDYKEYVDNYMESLYEIIFKAIK